MLKSIKKYLIKSSIFYYNNIYQVYRDIKYNISYQLQELDLNKIKGLRNKISYINWTNTLQQYIDRDQQNILWNKSLKKRTCLKI